MNKEIIMDNLSLEIINRNVTSLIKTLLSYDQCNEKYDICCLAIQTTFKDSHLDSLRQLVELGPIEDGNIISKNRRDDLISWGLASRIYYHGEQGYTAATYIGGNILNVKNSL